MKAKCLNPRRQLRWVGLSRFILPGKDPDGMIEPKDNMPLRVRKVTRSTWWLSRLFEAPVLFWNEIIAHLL